MFASLIEIFNQYSHIVSSAQDSVLPPDQSFDIPIEINGICEALFGGLYNWEFKGQTNRKSYLNDLLKKGFIFPLKFAAEAPFSLLKPQEKRFNHL